MGEDTIRVGIIGAGANTRRYHIPGLRALPGVELVAVANRSRESSLRAAEENGISQAAGHWREIIADRAIDAVCLGTWPCMPPPTPLPALPPARARHVPLQCLRARWAAHRVRLLPGSVYLG